LSRRSRRSRATSHCGSRQIPAPASTASSTAAGAVARRMLREQLRDVGHHVHIGESPTLRSLLASLLIIGGIALVSRPGAVITRMRPAGPS
jgi:hypothetical protein